MYLLADLTDDSRLEEFSSLAMMAAIEKSVAEPAAALLLAVVVVGFGLFELLPGITPLEPLHM